MSRGAMYTRGTVVGDYVVEKTLGEGGVAVVHRVRHRRSGTIHALKVLHVAHPGVRERLVLEGRVQAGIVHPNVVRVTEAVKLDEGVGLVMNYVSGPTLAAWLARNEPDLEEAMRLFSGIVRAVAVTHAHGVIHRDLKPANFLLDGPPHMMSPLLTDFGIVKVLDDLGPGRAITNTGAFLGSPAYMAPEQARDPRFVDQRSDLWSLGCILYELLLHRRAFPGEDGLSITNRVARGEFEPLGAAASGLPVEVVATLRALLAVDLGERIQSCQELWERLDGDRHWGPLHPTQVVLPGQFDSPSELNSASATFLMSQSAVMPRDFAPPDRRSAWGPVLLGACALLGLVLGAAWWVS